MYELIQVLGKRYYIRNPAPIGLVKLNEQDVCLIDSDSDKDTGEKAQQAARKERNFFLLLKEVSFLAD